MKLYVLFQPNSESERPARELERELSRKQVEVELVDADSISGVNLTEKYDLTARPSAVLIRDDGGVVERWQSTFPLVDDIAYMAHQ